VEDSDEVMCQRFGPRLPERFRGVLLDRLGMG
jgi:hypothetical protein